MDLLPLIVITVTGAVGFCLMLAAFVLVARRGGWQRAMQPGARGRWPAPRRLMFVGAVLCLAYGLAVLLPGVVPWWDYSSPWTTWVLGAFFGFGAGVAGLSIYYGLRLPVRREAVGGADRIP